MNLVKRLIRSCIGTVLRLLPKGAPDFIYIRLLRFPLLRALTNIILLAILPKTVETAGGVLEINPKDPVVSGALALGVYEQFETKLLQTILKPGMTVLDMGANIGFFTTFAARMVGPTGRVIAMEPEPTNFALLEKNIARNGYTWVSLNRIAASDSAGTFTLHLSDSNKGRHSLVPTATKEFTTSIEVETSTVDALLASQKTDHIDFVKMDIEGAETKAFSGMTKLLTQPSLILLVEYSPSAITAAGTTPLAFLERLRSFGFQLFEIEEGAAQMSEIKDLAEFAGHFHAAMFTNLLCKKTPTP